MAGLPAPRQRAVTTEDGMEAGMEEYLDYIFPDEAAADPNLRLLEAAQRWKRQKVLQNGGGEAAAVLEA